MWLARILLAPEIMHKIVVVWTSAFPSHAPHVNQSFNLEQDVLASQWLYEQWRAFGLFTGLPCGSAAEVVAR